MIIFRAAGCKGDLAGLKAEVDLTRDQITLGDFELLIRGIPQQFDDLQTVPQGGRDRLQHVGGGNEHDVAQIKGDIQIMIRKRKILLRIEDLKQRGRGIAPEIAAELVDFIEHEDGVVGLGPADALDNAAGQGPDISPPMPPDLRLVPHTAQGNPDKFTAQGTGNGVAQRCFPGSRGAGETEDGPFDIGLQFAHRQVFNNALFGFFQAVMILIQDPSGFLDIQVVFRAFMPGEGRDPVQIG